ncbi:hypothetical protein DES34_10749 [Brevibacillus brevis]|nr:hypothetical protein DES34_10749 [Brevibacillus brevis]VEF91705.1 Uncharacterised protein [Brevibacillus brevis]
MLRLFALEREEPRAEKQQRRTASNYRTGKGPLFFFSLTRNGDS